MRDYTGVVNHAVVGVPMHVFVLVIYVIPAALFLLVQLALSSPGNHDDTFFCENATARAS